MEKLAIKISVLFVLCFLGGCTSYSTLEELEEKALVTGDWSAVERRERTLARYDAKYGPQCGAGMAKYCELYLGEDRCVCVKRDSMRKILARR
jgi:hypothetical protein